MWHDASYGLFLNDNDHDDFVSLSNIFMGILLTNMEL